MLLFRWMAVGMLLVLGLLVHSASPARADDDLERQFHSARRGIISQMRGKPALRAAAVRKLADYPIPEAAKLLLDQGMASADASVRQASYETLLGFKDDAEIAHWLSGEVSTDLKKKQFGVGTCAALAVLLASNTPEASESAEKLLGQAEKAPAGRLLVVTLFDLLGNAQGGSAEGEKVAGENAVSDASLAVLLKLKELAPFQNEFGPRRAYVQALIAIRQPPAVTELIDRLATTQGETRADILAFLSQISGESFATDQEWQAWWKAKQATFEFPLKDHPLPVEAPAKAGAGQAANGQAQVGQAPTGQAPAGQAVPSYYGLPLYGSRIVFVLDTSKSMRGPRIDAAMRELVRAIGDLPDGVHFSVVAFNTHVGTWQRELVPSSRESKAAATAFVLSQNLGSRTASYDALEAALALDTESIYFLTDGAPTGGKIVRPAEIVSVIGAANRVRRITINAIGIGVGPEGNVFDTFLKTLSEQNFGAYRRVDE